MTSAYAGEWRAISERLRHDQPWCLFCRADEGEEYLDGSGEVKRVRLTVDHIDANATNNERSNLRVLCSSCHGMLTSGNRWRC